jgi:hypothetical protein
MQQCRLAGAGFANQRQPLALGHFEAEAVENHEIVRA